MNRQSQWLFEAPLMEGSSSQSKRITLSMRPKPYLKLDRFLFDKASLTERLKKMVDNLANTVVRSWNSTQPIKVIRLIGHTDNTGAEKYNIGLGDRRAKAVEVTLQNKLKGLLGRIKIVVEPSPGESEPTADNKTKEGRARNRRVEVFITTGVLTPAPSPTQPNLRLPKDWLPPGSVIQTKPEDPYRLRKPIPLVPQGKSFHKWFDNKMAELRIPKVLRNQIWKAIFDRNWGLLKSLLSTTGFSSGTIESIIETARAIGDVKVR